MRKLSLCIGIDHYPGTGADLLGACADAVRWYNTLLHLGWDTSLLKNPTREELVSRFLALARSARADDQLLVSYAGHGTQVPDADGDEAEIDQLDEAWCPSDVVEAGPILDDELCLILRCAGSARATVISDSCHSGTITRLLPTAVEEGYRRARCLPWSAVRSAPLSRQLIASRRTRARTSRIESPRLLTLSACQSHQQSYEVALPVGRYGGVFTQAMLSTYEPTLTYRAWHARASQEIERQGYPQSPRLDGSTLARARRALA